MNEKQIMEHLYPVIEKIEALDLANNPILYKEWLEQTYFFVTRSVPLLKIAATTATTPAFANRCMEHIKEESGHDKIALHDLAELGVKHTELQEWDWTKAFYKRQFDLVEKKGELLLGYILALEGLAILAQPLSEKVVENYGPRASKFLKIHAEEDQEHLPLAIGQTLQLKCKDEILENYVQTLRDYEKFIGLLETSRGLIAA